MKIAEAFLLGKLSLMCKSMQPRRCFPSMQFQSVAGLQSSCLSQGNHFVKVPSQSIQIHNTGCFHWVTTTSIQLPHSCHAKLFDSKSSGSIASSLQTQIAQIYGPNKHGNVCVEVNPVQQQDGGVDCGLFAIAFATELAYGNDPVRVSYVQSAMRDHLLLCLEQGKMELFPCSRKPATTCIRKIVSFALYCVCKLPETGDMVCCDQCNDWYHYHCVGIKEEGDLPEQWFCKLCKGTQNKRYLFECSTVVLLVI